MAKKSGPKAARKGAKVNHVKTVDDATGGVLSRFKNYMKSSGMVTRKKKK